MSILAEVINRYGEALYITEAELLYHRLAPKNQNIEQSLDQLIQLTLLASEATHQGLAQHPNALDERDMAIEYISKGFEQ